MTICDVTIKYQIFPETQNVLKCVILTKFGFWAEI